MMKTPSDSRAVLRNVRDADGLRRLEASVTAKGDVVVEGYDYGDGVERALGVREYEWTWTIRVPHVPGLLRALEASDNVLSALENALPETGRPTSAPSWNRTGFPTKGGRAWGTEVSSPACVLVLTKASTIVKLVPGREGATAEVETPFEPL